MSVYTLTKESPTSASFTLASASEVNLSLLGGSSVSGATVVLELDKGGSNFSNYNVSLTKVERLLRVQLPANTYRLRLINAEVNDSYEVDVSPNA